jgi:hypothetical protein
VDANVAQCLYYTSLYVLAMLAFSARRFKSDLSRFAILSESIAVCAYVLGIGFIEVDEVTFWAFATVLIPRQCDISPRNGVVLVVLLICLATYFWPFSVEIRWPSQLIGCTCGLITGW